jgi:hypothetical protein
MEDDEVRLELERKTVCEHCDDEGLVEDENWSPEWNGQRREFGGLGGLIRCGFCDGDKWYWKSTMLPFELARSIALVEPELEPVKGACVSVFQVVLRSDSIGAALAERMPEQHARDLLRALHLGCGSFRVFRDGEELVYDPFGDDMGNHDGHDSPVIHQPATPTRSTS